MSSIAALIRSGLIWRAGPAAASLPYTQCTRDESSFMHEMFAESYPDPALLQRERRLAAPFGIAEIDGLLPHGGLPFGTVHEWFNTLPHPHFPKGPPALSVLSSLAVSAWLRSLTVRSNMTFPRFTVWIGRESRPAPQLLWEMLRGRGELAPLFFQHALFIISSNQKEKLWSIESALRSPAVAAVISSIPELSGVAARRFSLAAERGGSLGLITRSLREQRAPLLTASRWITSALPNPATNAPRWKLLLDRYKGGALVDRSWEIELSSGMEERTNRDDLTAYYETERQALSLRIPSDLVDQSGGAHDRSSTALEGGELQQIAI